MSDIPRHSVDVPISRTLVALRRVRSLRDPCTNSMSKFASLLDNVKWETSSSNGISLQYVNHEEDGSPKVDDLVGLGCFVSESKMEEQGNGRCLDKSSSLENVGSPVDAERFGGLTENVQTSRLHSKRCCGDLMHKDMALACAMPYINPIENVNSGDADVGLSCSGSRDDGDIKPKYRSDCPTQSNGTVGYFTSRVASPIPLINYGFVDEDIYVVDQCNRGCGISYCWPRTPRLRESNTSTDVEDYPLLSGNTSESPFHGNWCRKRSSNEITPCLEMPSSLSHKFRPKSFDELVGQEVVVKSLVSAIFRGRITSVYLFHGPRGTGKTCTSRIFAAALNCLSPAKHSKPCSLCRECTSFLSGRSRDMKEMDPVKVNRTDRLRSLIRSAYIPPISSRYKIFIIDECQLLCQQTWVTLLNSLDKFSRHVVFVLVTPELEKLPRTVVSQFQKYHFPKIKNADISSKLTKICTEEGIEFDRGALDVVASKSDGSLRDAEIMLDQLSLVGKRVTISLAYELIGVVSDEELLDLLDLAMSSDTSSTVIRARELMRSKVDPMQLIAQLANLIMDILAGKCQERCSAARVQFHARHTSGEEMQKLSHALKILSDAEKQLRASKNQRTWLTVALLQLSNVDSSSAVTKDSRLCLRSPRNKDIDFCSTSSEGESLKHFVHCPCDTVKSQIKEGDENCNGTLESIWKKVTELCRSDSLKNFLLKRGKLTSLSLDKGFAFAELEFYAPQHASRAEKSWRLIADSFQSVLGCNVEICINRVISVCSPERSTKAGRFLFGFLSCSRRILEKSSMSTRSDSDHSDHASEKHAITDGRTSACTTGCGAPRTEKMVNSLRSCRGNVLISGPILLRCQNTRSSNASSRMSCESQGDKKVTLSTPMKVTNGTYIYSDDPAMSQGRCQESQDEPGLKDDSDVLCWRTTLNKSWRETQQNRSSRLMGCVLPCTATS